MAVGVNTSSSPVGFVITSPDGLTWRNITANLGGTNPFVAIKTVSWNGARWFIGGEIDNIAGTYSSFTSVDTITWVPVTTGLTNTVYSSAFRRVLPYVGLTVDGSAGSTGPTGPAGGGIVIVTNANTSNPITLTQANAGTTFIIIGKGNSQDPAELLFIITNLGLSDVGLYWFVKNAFTENVLISVNTSGNPVTGQVSELGFSENNSGVITNSSTQILYLANQSTLVMY
jgi:hypothetical protein